jgi:hypothetical protein
MWKLVAIVSRFSTRLVLYPNNLPACSAMLTDIGTRRHQMQSNFIGALQPPFYKCSRQTFQYDGEDTRTML